MGENQHHNHFQKNGSRIILMGLFIFLFHGAKLNSVIIGIDTEDIINMKYDFYNGWLTTGRQGLVFLKWLFGCLEFNPYLAGFMTLIFFVAGTSAFFLLWDKYTGWDKPGLPGWFLGGLLWISHPIITEQFYFSLQSVEICMGFVLLACALLLTEKWIQSKHILYGVASVILLIICFSLYQVFVAIYIFGTVTLLLLKGLAEEDINVYTLLKKRLLPHVLVFLSAFALNTVITKLFFSGSDYLQEQILWETIGFGAGVKGILGHIYRACTGADYFYYNCGYGILFLITLVLFLLVLRKTGHSGAVKGILIFFLFCLFLTPFLMTIVCGGAPAVRSQLVLPMATGFLAYLDLYLLHFMKEKAIRSFAVLIAAVSLMTGFHQLQLTMRLYYTDSMRFEHDVSMGRDLIQRIENVRNEEWLPVIIIGRKEFPPNKACLFGEVIGKSMFDYDLEAEPQFYWSTRRARGLFEILGHYYDSVEGDDIAKAIKYSKDMPMWPAEGCVQVYDGMIIVKLEYYG